MSYTSGMIKPGEFRVFDLTKIFLGGTTMEKRSILAICVSIIAGFIILGVLVCYGLMNTTRYQMISHGSNVIILDQKTGEYWQKF